MQQSSKTEALAIPFDTETVGAGMNVRRIAEAINEALAGRVYLGHLAIRRADIGDQLKGPDGIILLVAAEAEPSTAFPAT